MLNSHGQLYLNVYCGAFSFCPGLYIPRSGGDLGAYSNAKSGNKNCFHHLRVCVSKRADSLWKVGKEGGVRAWELSLQHLPESILGCILGLTACQSYSTSQTTRDLCGGGRILRRHLLPRLRLRPSPTEPAWGPGPSPEHERHRHLCPHPRRWSRCCPSPWGCSLQTVPW